MIVRDPFWEERKTATPIKPDAVYANLDKKKPFGFGFGVHPAPEPEKKTDWKKP